MGIDEYFLWSLTLIVAANEEIRKHGVLDELQKHILDSLKQ